MAAREVRVRPLAGFAEIGEGAPLGTEIAATAEPGDGEIVVVSQKAVSKSEGRLRRLGDVNPGPRARELAAMTGKEPALVELVLSESRSVIRAAPGVLITETNGGWICANAGIDSSNLPEEGLVALLPEDPDASARRIRGAIRASIGTAPAVVVADSFGRPWRLGQTDIAVGCAGILALDDWRGRRDQQGRELAATAIAVIDELASAADLARDKDSGVPGAVVSGLGHLVTAGDGPGARVLQRPPGEDLFR
ncbi:MAG TPA: coenzyme F420-0:L-glutamate ligase [Solirubrobacterales bacterium]|jgi:coenzyme F420-0:L-glutamate ligase/coenzyme F420-1:gamma-L-glutamate ligase|nr:coenzyme F420-0:L-glutamate ligase [Solirubrobacterales bacterium]